MMYDTKTYPLDYILNVQLFNCSHKQCPRRTYVARGGSSQMISVVANLPISHNPALSKTSRMPSLALFGPFLSLLGLVGVGVGARCAGLHLVAAPPTSDVNDG